VILVLLSSLALALPADTSDADVIMAAVEDRDTGDRSTTRLAITITDGAGRERKRAVVGRAMDHDGASRQLSLFESPADVRNAGVLAFDWDDANKADDQWLYLPSVGKPTRISGADRSGSFMGTDLTYADMTRKDPADYTYTLIDGNGEVSGESCWVVGAVGTEEEKKETGYAKTQIWVSKDKLVPVQTKAWVTAGKKLKYTKFEDYTEVSGIWVAKKITVRSVRNGEVESESQVLLTEVAFDQEDVTPEDFTERRLERGL
jgi:hypothetical protein